MVQIPPLRQRVIANRCLVVAFGAAARLLSSPCETSPWCTGRRPAAHTGPVKTITVGELSAYLHVHRSTIYRMVKRHEIPAFHVGGDWRFNIEEVDRWRLQQENFIARRNPRQ